MKYKPKITLLRILIIALILTIASNSTITNIYGEHGSYISMQYLTGEESFDRNKDIPIRFSILNKNESECVLLSNIGIAFDQQTDILPKEAQKNFTLPGTAEIPPKSTKIFTVNMRLHQDTPAAQYTIKVFAEAGSCSDPSHSISIIDGPRLGLNVPPAKSQCVIATATYGSELASEVRFLRNFRDSTVLSTYSGSNFMTLFNAFYYSWSPTVADTIRDDDHLKNISRIIMTPLLAILKAGSIAGENSEAGVITSGILSSILIGAVYVTPTSLVSLVALRRSISKNHMKYFLIVWIAGLALTVMASLLHIDTFMMVSAGILVLSSIGLGSAGLTFTLNRLRCYQKRLN